MDKTIDELEAIRLRDLSICLKKAVALSDLKDVEYLSDIIIDCDNKVKCHLGVLLNTQKQS